MGEAQVTIDLSPDDKEEGDDVDKPSRCSRCLSIFLFGWGLIYNFSIGIFLSLQIYKVHTQMPSSLQSSGWTVFLFILAYFALLTCPISVFFYHRNYPKYVDFRHGRILIGGVILVVAWFNEVNHSSYYNLFYGIGWVSVVSPLLLLHHQDDWNCTCPRIEPRPVLSQRDADRERRDQLDGLYSHLQRQREIAAMNRPPPPVRVHSSYGW